MEEKEHGKDAFNFSELWEGKDWDKDDMKKTLLGK